MHKSPFIVFWELTRACMLACKHCRAKAIRKRNPKELTSEECFMVIDQLASFNPKPLLIFTGGDPLMRDDVTEIISYASDKKFRTAIAFSGTEMATKDKLLELNEAGIARIAVSIDGSYEDMHDSFRGIRGTFRMSMKIIENAREVGIPFQINTTVTRQNILDLPNIAELCLNLGAVMWDVFFVVPTGRAKIEIMPTPQQFEDVLSWLYDLSRKTGLNVKSSAATHLRRIELMRDGGRMPEVSGLYWQLLDSIGHIPEGEAKKIVAGGYGRSISIGDGIKRIMGITDGRGMLFISHVGDVCPSGFLPITAGNVREHEISEIYTQSRIFVDLNDPNKLKGKCGVCEYRKICGGSRARAYALTGDYLEAEPCCIYNPAEVST